MSDRLQSHVFLNTLSGLAAHDMATTVLIANTVDRTANYYAGSALTASGTKEKHLTEAIEAIRANRSKPRSEDGDIEDALYRQLCTTQIVSLTSREKMSRSRCEDIKMIETLICVIPDELPTEPSEQVMAVKVTCLLNRGEKEEIGFLNLFDGKTMTVGWNCEL